MMKLIADEMGISYDYSSYVYELYMYILQHNFPFYLEMLSAPTVQVMPSKKIPEDIICTAPSCSIMLEKTVSFSTTNSFEASLAIEAGVEPFGVGVKLTAMVGCGFSATSESSVSLSYAFNLKEGNAGYIGMVIAQISAELRYAICPMSFLGQRSRLPYTPNLQGHLLLESKV